MSDILDLLQGKETACVNALDLLNSGTGYFYPSLKSNFNKEKEDIEIFNEITAVNYNGYTFGYIIPLSVIYDFDREPKKSAMIIHFRCYDSDGENALVCYCGPKQILHDCIIRTKDKKDFKNILKTLLDEKKYIFDEERYCMTQEIKWTHGHIILRKNELKIEIEKDKDENTTENNKEISNEEQDVKNIEDLPV